MPQSQTFLYVERDNEWIMILCCPVCQSTEIYEVIGGYSGQIYRCKHCGYRGSLIVEVDEHDLREALGQAGKESGSDEKLT